MGEVRRPYGPSSRESFDPLTATEDQVRERVARLPGLRLSDVAVMRGRQAHSTRETKGSVGAIYEAYFGILPNSSPEPDFRDARIELKTVPLENRGRGLSVKERTVLSMIDYGSLVAETWERASVRKKLDRILFVFYEWAPDTDIFDFRTESCVLWSPDEQLRGLCEADWDRVRRKVRAGLAHTLSESDGRVMGPATKGADGSRRVPQPYSAQPAKPRAWAFKPTVTTAIRLEAMDGAPFESLADNLAARATDGFEAASLEHFRSVVGLSVGEAADRLGVPRSTGYAFKAAVVRRALGARNVRSRIKEFERLGIEVKTIRVSPEARPYEAMSFPAFRYGDLVREEWEGSDLARRLQRLLIVPIEGPVKATRADDCVIHAPFYWSPSPEEAIGIAREWTRFRNEIRAGRALSLTPASETRFVHVRPHGQDAKDVDEAPGVGPVVKKSFWLNQPFVQGLIRAHSDRWRP